jgi:REP element-mobilizing transposase RayT
MPGPARVMAVGVPHPITHRGNHRQDVFLTDEDRRRYQRFLRLHLGPCQADLLGWCWMSNHVHLIVVPHAGDSLARLIRRVHSGYAQDFQATRRTSTDAAAATVTCGEVVSIPALWGRRTSTRRCFTSISIRCGQQ